MTWRSTISRRRPSEESVRTIEKYMRRQAEKGIIAEAT